MPRKPLIRSTLFPYHVVYRCNNREWFKLPMDRAWEITSLELFRISFLCGARIHAFVLMSNHLHLVISTPELDLGKTMAQFGRSMTRTFNRASGRSGHLFGGRYGWSIIQSPLYYANVVKYVYRNPVRAGILATVEDYPYSSLYGLLGKGHLPFPLYYPEPERLGLSFVPYEIENLLAWLNQPFRTEMLAAIDRGLKQKVFILPDNPQKVKTSSEWEADT